MVRNASPPPAAGVSLAITHMAHARQVLAVIHATATIPLSTALATRHICAATTAASQLRSAGRSVGSFLVACNFQLAYLQLSQGVCSGQQYRCAP